MSMAVLQGMLSIGAALLGSCHVIGIDIDSDALATAQSNVEAFEDLQVGILLKSPCWIRAEVF